jgi:hypothetical protein
MRMKRKRTIRKKKKKKKKWSGAKVRQKERKYLIKDYCCIYCDIKNRRYRCRRNKCFLLPLPLSGSLTYNKNVWLEWKFSKYTTRHIVTKFGYVFNLLLAFLFIRKYYPSKHIIFCNQSNKSLSSNFYAEFRNSLPLHILDQLLSRTSKATKCHNCLLSISY